MIGLAMNLAAFLRVPHRLQAAFAWLALIGAGVLLAWGAAWAVSEWLDAREARAVRAELEAQDARAATNRVQSAEERGIGAIERHIAKGKRVEAVADVVATEAAKPPAERATLAPQIRAFNCAVMREDYTPAELARMAAYREACL